MDRSAWPRRLMEWMRDRCYVFRIKSEYQRKADQDIEPGQFTDSERALLAALLQQIAERIHRRTGQLQTSVLAVQKAKTTHTHAKQAEAALGDDHRSADIDKEYTELKRQVFELDTNGAGGQLSSKAALIASIVLFLADFPVMLWALSKGIDVPFPGGPDFSAEIALNTVKLLGAIAFSLVGPVIVILCARLVAARLADRRARHLLATARPEHADPPPGLNRQDRRLPRASGAQRGPRWLRMLRTGGRAARDHAAVIIAYLLVALITAIYWYTASARLAAEGRIPDNLVQSIAALLSALAPATVVAYVSTEKSSTHRALRRAQDQYGQLLEERARRQAAVVNAAAMWEQAWLHAVELLAQVKAETTMAMNKEYTRFERLVLLARSKTDRAPLYEGRPPQPTGPDLGKWLADTGLLRTPQSLAQPNGELASINETLERLRPPQPPGGTWTPHGVPASNGSSGTRDRTRT